MVVTPRRCAHTFDPLSCFRDFPMSHLRLASLLSVLSIAVGCHSPYYADRGAALGGISIGSHTLAEAGQLEGHRCTIHWENRASFREAFPHIECTGNVYEIDRKRYTSAGGTTSVDLMLEIVRSDFGSDLANKVANQFQHERIRSHHDRQRVGQDAVVVEGQGRQRRDGEPGGSGGVVPPGAPAGASCPSRWRRESRRSGLRDLSGSAFPPTRSFPSATAWTWGCTRASWRWPRRARC